MLAQSSKQLEEFLLSVETEPASEFIDGYVVAKPMPQGEHSTLQSALVEWLNRCLKPNKIARAYPKLRCTFGGRSIVPDISVCKWQRIPRRSDGRVANLFQLAPDWLIEILSPQQSQVRLVDKILHSFGYGTQMGWLIDPETMVILVFSSPDRVCLVSHPTANLPVPDFASSIHLTGQMIFNWLWE